MYKQGWIDRSSWGKLTKFKAIITKIVGFQVLELKDEIRLSRALNKAQTRLR